MLNAYRKIIRIFFITRLEISGIDKLNPSKYVDVVGSLCYTTLVETKILSSHHPVTIASGRNVSTSYNERLKEKGIKKHENADRVYRNTAKYSCHFFYPMNVGSNLP